MSIVDKFGEKVGEIAEKDPVKAVSYTHLVILQVAASMRISHVCSSMANVP